MPTKPEFLQSLFCHRCSNLKRAFWVEWAFLNLHNRLFRNAFMYLPNWLKIIHSNTFDNKGKILTGRKFILSIWTFLLCIGVTFAFFKVTGNFPLIKTWFMQIVHQKKFDFFNIFTVRRSLIIVFIFSVVAILNEKLSLTLYRSSIFTILERMLNLQTMLSRFNSSQTFL